MPDATSPSWDALYATAELQAGYFTTAQGAEAGYSPQLLYKHLKAGRIRRVRRGIYRLVHFPMSDDEHLVECWLWVEQVGVFSHETALFYHDLSDVLPTHVYLTVPKEWRGRRLRVPEGLALHRGHVPEAERTWHGPVPITKPARTIRDVINTHLSPEHIERALADARYRGLLDGDEADQLEARLRETPRT
jgi:predicted transcriptional regulator of viral defense system